MQTNNAKPAFYNDCEFRSSIKACWPVCWATLEVMQDYESQHYELGLKHIWDRVNEYVFKEALLDRCYEELEPRDLCQF